MEFLAFLYTVLLVAICLMMALLLYRSAKPAANRDDAERKEWLRQQLEAQNRQMDAKLAEMAQQIQKTCSYGDLDTLARMCNYPMTLSFADGTNKDISTQQQLIQLGEKKVLTEKLLKAIDQVDVSKLQEVGDAGVMMGGDSGINLRKINGYWKINQIYQ